MKRKDYQMVAEKLREMSHGVDPDHIARNGGSLVKVTEQDVLETVVDLLVKAFREENGLFQEDRFRMAALGYVSK